MAVQFIKSNRPGKPITWFVYAWKGGPRILKAEQPAKPKLKPEHHRAIADALTAANLPNPGHLISVIRNWRTSPEWKGLAAGTKDLWGRQLDLVEGRWGDKPISVWDDPRMVKKVIKWRDERASTPRSADIGVMVLSELIKFGKLRGDFRINVAADVPRLYKGANRQEIIWTAEDIEAFRIAAEADDALHIYDGLRLAAATGLRRADLVSLTWKHLGEFAIVKTAMKKSRGKRRKAAIPMTQTLEELLDELRSRPRKDGVEHVLVNSRGVPWTGMGFGTSFNRIRNLANVVHVEEGDDGERIERRKHLHDVRGTFCTLLLTEWEATDEIAADIMGWSPAHVSNIRKVYVDGAQVVVAFGKRLRAKQDAKQPVSDDAESLGNTEEMRV